MTPRWRCVAALGLLVPLGLATKAYSGPGARWVVGNAGGVLYVAFWIVLARAVWPPGVGFRAGIAAPVVLLVTCALEVLQTVSTPWLDAARSHFVGRTLLGATFSWWDFPHYVAGAVLGAGLVVASERSTAPAECRGGGER